MNRITQITLSTLLHPHRECSTFQSYQSLKKNNSTYYQAELAELTLTRSGATTVTSESGLTSLRVGFSSQEGIGVTGYQIGFPTGQLGLPNQDQGYALDSLRVNDKAYGSTQCGSAAIFVSNSGSNTTATVYYPTVIFYTNADQIFSVNTFNPVMVTF